MWYKLDSNNNPIPCSSVNEYQEWYKIHGDTVAKSNFLDASGKQIIVSTVFLGLDHSYNSKVPVLWETMIFGGEHDQYQRRYTNFYDSLEGHNESIDLACSKTVLKDEPVDVMALFKKVLKDIKNTN